MGYLTARCSSCSLDWPDDDAYRKCPQCERTTTRIYGAPMDPPHAASLANHLNFERFYTEREAKVISDLDAAATAP